MAARKNKVHKNTPVIALSIILLFCLFAAFFLKNLYDKYQNQRLANQQTLNEQKFNTFKEGFFQIDYPYWANVDKSLLLEPTVTRLAVSNAGCSFVITKHTLAKNQTLSDFVEKALADQKQKYPTIKISQKTVTENSSLLVGEFTTGGMTLKSYSKGFLVGVNQLYDVAFVSQKDSFDNKCGLFIDKTFASVNIKSK